MKILSGQVKKICTSCKQEKGVNEFHRQKGGRHGVVSTCKKCRNQYRKNHYDKCDKEKHRIRNREWKINNPIKSMLIFARANAKKRGLKFELTTDDIYIPAVCPLLEIPIKKNGNRYNWPSIDRKDSNIGYIKNNIWVISTRANLLKNNATIDEIKTIAKNIHKSR